MKFKIGDHVRIGCNCSSSDRNYHKRGIVNGYNEILPIVQMIDPFADGRTNIDWCPEHLWELDPSYNKNIIQVDYMF